MAARFNGAHNGLGGRSVPVLTACNFPASRRVGAGDQGGNAAAMIARRFSLALSGLAMAFVVAVLVGVI